jgi:chemotaxis protein methyltransferase CheR
MVQFKRLNLLHDTSALGHFDIVFCRNVLIYFDRPTKMQVLDSISRQMPPDGYLVLGGAETVLGITDRFRAVDGKAGLYAPATAPLARAV